MALSAFHSQAAVRQEALSRLGKHITASRLVAGSLMWDGVKGSIAGCLIECDDPAQWEERLGLARWIAYAIDAACGRLNPLMILDEVTALLEAIPVGLDTGSLGSRLICKLIEAATARAAPQGSLADALQTVVTLQQRCAQGEAISSVEWKQARRAALLANDASVPAPVEGQTLAPAQAQLRLVGNIVEAAAWDPNKSPSAVSEVLRGWTPQDHQQVRQLLDAMNQQYVVPNPGTKRTVFDHLAEDHPEVDARLRRYMQFGRDYGSVCAERVTALLRGLLGSLA
jgi:hypothetical protein